MKNRTELAKLFAKLDFHVGAEIGVETGYYSEVLCANNPELKLSCIDSWRFYDSFDDYKTRRPFEVKYEEAVKRLSKYNCDIINGFSMDVVKTFKDESLDFVYIDANHNYEFVRDDIREWTKKVREGGIVSGHDYIDLPGRNLGVIRAVDEYVKEHGYGLSITTHNGSRDHRCPSWFFTKI